MLNDQAFFTDTGFGEELPGLSPSSSVVSLPEVIPDIGNDSSTTDSLNNGINSTSLEGILGPILPTP